MKSKIILSVVMLLSFGACTKKTTNEFIEETIIHYIARKCNYVWADNIKSEIIVLGKVSAVENSVLKENDNVKISQYTLAINTCNRDISEFSTDYQNYFNSERYNPLSDCPFMALSNYKEENYSDPKDEVIEKKIHQYLVKSFPNISTPEPQTLLEFVDYRTDALTGIEITCSEPLFGVEAGKSLNEFFQITGYPMYHNFIVTTNKQLVTGRTRDISIQQYLSYSPLAPAAMHFQIKKGSISNSVTAQFTIKLEINGEKTIRATTKLITLEP